MRQPWVGGVHLVSPDVGGSVKPAPRVRVENMRIIVPYVNTHANLADFFTKPLKPQQFFAMRDAIMNAPARQGHNPLDR